MNEQILFWTTLGFAGLSAFMVFMYGIAWAKYFAQIDRAIYLKANIETLQSQLKDTLLELTAEIESRKETSEQLYKAAHEMNDLKKLIPKRGTNGQW